MLPRPVLLHLIYNHGNVCPIDSYIHVTFMMTVDPNEGDLSVFESAAIMIYLEEAYGKGNLLPTDKIEKAKVMEWLMFQMVRNRRILGVCLHGLLINGTVVAF